MLSPLQLERHWLDELQVVAAAPKTATPGDDGYHITFDRTVRTTDEAHRFEVSLTVGLKPVGRGARFRRIRAKMTGLFVVHPDCPAEVTDQLIPGNALAILYGLLRAAVAQTTGITRSGQLVMPTVTIPALIGDDVTVGESPKPGPDSLAAPGHVED
jgi:preprotein translocase subunit SecB